MTVKLDLPSQVEQAYRAAAQSRGLSLADVMREVLVAGQPSSSALNINPEDWMREFKAWAHSHDADNLPVLSDQALSRDSIYD